MVLGQDATQIVRAKPDRFHSLIFLMVQGWKRLNKKGLIAHVLLCLRAFASSCVSHACEGEKVCMTAVCPCVAPNPKKAAEDSKRFVHKLVSHSCFLTFPGVLLNALQTCREAVALFDSAAGRVQKGAMVLIVSTNRMCHHNNVSSALLCRLFRDGSRLLSLVVPLHKAHHG